MGFCCFRRRRKIIIVHSGDEFIFQSPCEDATSVDDDDLPPPPKTTEPPIESPTPDSDLLNLSVDMVSTTSSKPQNQQNEQVKKVDADRQQANTEGNLDDEDSLAFVTKIAQSNDHCYSMQVSEPNLEVDSEEVVETI